MSASRKWMFGVLAMCGLNVSGAVQAYPENSVEAGAKPVPSCGPHQLDGVSAADNIAAHRQFELPTLSYAGNAVPSHWNVPFTLLVDASGRVACQVMDSEFGQPRALNNTRRELLRAMSGWRYRPFGVDGKPSAVVISERVAEQQVPSKHQTLPDVPLDQVTISLSRSGCFGTCPSYEVSIHGNGKVDYEGVGDVDVQGKHSFSIPPADVAALVENARRADLWSMRTSYSALITDSPTYVLILKMGQQRHEIEDYVGRMVGMPVSVGDFEEEVDRVGRTFEWTSLSMAAVEQLQREGFDFDSQQAADTLARAVANERGSDEAAMLRMIDLGTPLKGGNAARPPPGVPVLTESTLLNDALVHHRAALIGPLVARGLLNTHGVLDRNKLDKAFQDAIRGGRLAAVRKIWNTGDGKVQPSLWFVDESDEGASATRKRVPVALLLSRSYRDAHWDGQAIAEWLAAKGCDLKARAADGDTLLHRAVDAGDIGFVRYLLLHGLDASTPGAYGLPALGSAQNEDIALLLLRAGSSWHMDDGGAGFGRYAKEQHWARVLAYLEQHKDEAR
ncbi:ankyrin repeat domain-containing protein [Rhodanobacter sp. Root179]|uniref:ankyrin repeat domain-containing protein n=1 Tax=Rhodanobacter sp. Root179 TaxID=1736482 RepID=UPI000AD6C21C|nr:ankyrin repeat domain-containing protein [Rhodanobacter sp. Root179]